MDQVCQLPNTTSFVKDKLPCDVTFATDGWFYIEFPSENFCCKCSNAFGAVRYDWLQENSTYVGTATVDGKITSHWTKNGQMLNHYYATVDKQLPVKFFQLEYGHPKTWDFDLDTYSTATIDPSKFAPKCANQCPGRCENLLPNNTNSITGTQQQNLKT